MKEWLSPVERFLLADLECEKLEKTCGRDEIEAKFAALVEAVVRTNSRLNSVIGALNRRR